MSTEIVAPCHWDKDVVDEITQQNSEAEGVRISALYGAMANGEIPHGRNPESVRDISREETTEFRHYLEDQGLGFIYLLNAPFEFTDREQKARVEEYLDWIVDELEPSAVTISSHQLAEFVRDRYESLNIFISTIAGVLNTEQLDRFMDIDPARVVLHHDANRNWHDLELLVRHAQKAETELELMLTESCLRGCLRRDAHYKFIARQDKTDTGFHTICNTRKLTYPREFLRSNFIRPEDMHIYEDMGIDKFKITGRSKPAHWLPEVTGAYLNRSYDGNLIRLLGIDPSLAAEEWLSIDNRSLDGFLEEFPTSGITAEEEAYCDKWANRLHSDGNLVLHDGTEYWAQGQVLELRAPGCKVASIIARES